MKKHFQQQHKNVNFCLKICLDQRQQKNTNRKGLSTIYQVDVHEFCLSNYANPMFVSFDPGLLI